MVQGELLTGPTPLFLGVEERPMIKDNRESTGELLPEKRKMRPNHRQLRQRLLTLHRLVMAAGIWFRRYRYEQELLQQDTEPRFRVSWEKLKGVAERPSVLVGGFGKFMHRLHRLARSETDEAVSAYHAVSRRVPQPEPTTPHEPPREE